jgi:outer-membrane receptor for ferric coprogen and ferric-rhodotorulic acid
MSNQSGRPFTQRALVFASSLLAGATFAQAASSDADPELETVLITAQRAERVSRGATGLDLAIKDTPQSISVVTQELMDDFGANELNDALRLATGINVEEWETNRTNYLARGFEIKNTQVDGVGLPNDWGIVTGAMDSYGYDKLEVIRGANGLLTGVGNASGTLNYVRKRPSNDTRGQLTATTGSWNARRIEADYSTPFTDSGAWAGRIVAAYDDSDSWLRGLDNRRYYIYGVVDGQLGDRTTLALGYSFQDADTHGNMWGALSLTNSDGTQPEFARNASTTQDWTFWNTRNQNAFLELTYAFSDRWTLKGSYNFRKSSEDDQLFFAYSSTGLDPATHTGLFGWPGKYQGGNQAHLGELSLSGTFEALGRSHELMLGISQANSAIRLDNYSVDPADPAFGALPAFPYAGNAVAEPAWGPRSEYDHYGQWMRRVYGATRLSLTDRLKAIAGFNLARFHRQGINSFGLFYEQTENELSPYAGLTFDLTDHALAYASYSDIYQPQDQYDIHQNFLAPSKGENYELGVKAEWFGKRLLTTAALFKAEQKGLATYAGFDPVTNNYYYEGVDVRSKGIEIEATGKLGEHAELVLGFTTLKLEGADGAAIYKWVPRQTVNLSLSSQLPVLPALRLGLNGRWQSRISTEDGYTGGTVAQDGYATVTVFGQWKLTPGASLRANINNVTNKKYIGSLYQVGYYGAPRNYSLGIDYRF